MSVCNVMSMLHVLSTCLVQHSLMYSVLHTSGPARLQSCAVV